MVLPIEEEDMCEYHSCYMCGESAVATCHFCENTTSAFICEKHVTYVTPESMELPLSCCSICSRVDESK